MPAITPLLPIATSTFSFLANNLPLVAVAITTAYTVGWLPQLQTLLAAEGGRKQDLVRRSQVQGFDFDVMILLPFYDEKQYLALVDCLACLTAQQYPEHKVKWVILATANVQAYQANFETLAGKNGSPLIWLNAPSNQTKDTLLSWGCSNALSQYPAQLVAFLDPSDLVKPDFLNQLTAKAYSHQVIQGYVASREYKSGWFNQLIGIETRIASRIETAGRFHAKKPLILRTSGFAIKTTLLEQLPWPAVEGNQASWLYSLALAQHEIPIVWAPTVVVYQRSNPSLGNAIQVFWQEVTLRFTLGLQSFGLIFKRTSPSAISSIELTSYWWATPSALSLTTAVALIFGGLQFNQPNTQTTGIVLAVMVIGLQLATFGVSRLPWQEWIAYALLKPLFLTLSLLALPFLLVQNSLQQIGRLIHNLSNTNQPQKTNTATKTPSARVQQTLMPTPEKKPAEEALPYWLSSNESANTTVTKPDHLPKQLFAETPPLKPIIDVAVLENLWEKTVASFQTIAPTYTVPLLFGTKSVEALIEVETTPSKGIQLTLQYKQQSFKTATYPLFSQAFYELQEKLSPYNIQINSCGGCAYYYQPASAMQATQQKQVGLCLKQAQQQEALKPITVLSATCPQKAPLNQRASVLSSIKNTLAQPV
jgi:Glycosyltransferase like family 2